MVFHQIEQWFNVLQELGYFAGFIILYLRAIVPVLPLTLYVIMNVHAYGFLIGTGISWLGIVSGTYTVFYICRKFVNAHFMQKIRKRKSVVKLTHFIDRQGLVPIFILMCFPFTPNTLVNFVASLSHIKAKYYFLILLVSKLISITFLAVMGKEVTTFLTHPIRAVALLIVTVALWFIGKRVEKYFMGADEE
ncbi:TVP38/TMEM64 family protein [Staphylococcus sp. NRL 16/872]|uniref:TVP38/TMEM64 family protein n=1 Tax=Staphylococcus sp. NRL 16/872 TaxID=2930131 RepID=UPI001FB2113B|nr:MULTISPECIES: TVP38/TMEM64 family protein [unclassified Staphylococcus]MCJ1656787.1 TVP38/TMEM64 family protein [Staphylococcus sp. NRL 21/187]MCJ1662536.1 TVP38/TMEM64 family protein [Staphylococcus sp. NRL 18/288]MCJ1668631.1 TVP38/TMEM64 family protein [Staphylococcus sp. NRL 19/737]WEN70595.1 TVP38/TMEM64 family protein [Staphylococcus sp. NRL 16/872]